MLSDEQLLRYNRQLMLPALDVAGQERLLAASVLVVGLGGLGCPAALYLAASGVGRLLLADDDVVEPSNLQRQVAHGEADIGRSKVASAADSIAAINSDTVVEQLPERLDERRLNELLTGVDLVVDASDSFSTRFAINRACLAAGTPLVSGAAIRSEGQVAVFEPGAGTPCYRCLYPADQGDEQLSCSENGGPGTDGRRDRQPAGTGGGEAVVRVRRADHRGHAGGRRLVHAGAAGQDETKSPLSGLCSLTGSGRRSCTHSRRQLRVEATAMPTMIAHQKPVAPYRSLVGSDLPRW